jgi:hypothetical protein
MFSFHAYRSWMPDHRRGYTRRGEGYQPPDPEMARNYERRAKHDRSWFDPEIQKSLIARAQEACVHLDCRLHGFATELGHVLVSWKHSRTWQSIRTSIKSSLTRCMREKHLGIEFSRGASRKHVEKRPHFDHLMETYLPDHPGWGWYEDKGWIEPKR